MIPANFKIKYYIFRKIYSNKIFILKYIFLYIDYLCLHNESNKYFVNFCSALSKNIYHLTIYFCFFYLNASSSRNFEQILECHSKINFLSSFHHL